MSSKANCLALMLVLLTPSVTEAQLVDRIRDRVSKSIDEQKARADSAIVSEAGSAADSAVDLVGDGVGAGAEAMGGLVDTALHRIRDIAIQVFEADQGDAEAYAKALAAGTLVLQGIELQPGSHQLTPKSRRVMKRLADAVRASEGSFLIEEYADSGGCAVAVKLELVAAGIASNRLLAVLRSPAGPRRLALTRIAG